MKKGKSDVSDGYATDAILNAPDELFDHLADVYRSWLIHGTVTTHLLACAFLPLLKSSLKDPADTNSYRAIAGSSIILKLFDKVVLLVWGDLLTSDSLQFGYKAKTSTTHCSWLVMEVTNHFLRNGSNPILTLLDCTKAFDTCKFDVLFQKLLDRKLPPLVVRTLAVVYQEQYAWVRWGSSRSDMFSILNGTRQGSVLSPALFSVYMDDLLLELRALGVGCYVGGVYMGAVGFADDILLLAPSRCAMKLMLSKCEDFAIRHNLQFSTDPDPRKSKSKCIFVCGRNRNLAKPATLTLYGADLPWVSTATHLGHELSEDGTMDTDVRGKRAAFVTRSTEIRETFGFASPLEVLKAVKVYTCDFYGSMLWDLGGDQVKQLLNCWSTCVKIAWNVPRATHTYFVDHLLACDLSSARVDIMDRYLKFCRGLLKSPTREVLVMANISARDVRSTVGKNLHFISVESGKDPWNTSPGELKSVLTSQKTEVPLQDKWRLEYLARLLGERGHLYYECKNTRMHSNLIDSLCIN